MIRHSVCPLECKNVITTFDRKAGGFGGRAFKPMAMYSPPPPPMAEALYSAEPVGNLLDYVVPVTALVSAV